jgi:hypothetical protein
MSTDSLFSPELEFTEKQRIAANQEMLDRVATILFAVFMNDEPMGDDEIDELLEECFGMATIVMAVCGMKIIGENTDGDYVARFKPYKSLEHFTESNM